MSVPDTLVRLGSRASRAADAEYRLGAKAAHLARARAAGLPVLPGWVVPATLAGPALAAGAAAVRGDKPAAARRAVLTHPFDPALTDALSEAAARLGGRVIVRSSSPLEADARWSGAFSSVSEVRADEVGAAVRSCWASAFAVDPLERLEACGLNPAALSLAALIQPEIVPESGGLARLVDGTVIVEGVAGHPGALLSGWAEAAVGHGLDDLAGPKVVAQVEDLAAATWRATGDDVIEWAADSGGVWLLQARRSGPARALAEPAPADPASADPASADTASVDTALSGPALADPALADPVFAGRLLDALCQVDRPADPAGRVRWMPFIAAVVLARGKRVAAAPAAPGVGAGRLVPCTAHTRRPADYSGAILLVDRPVPALAPLLFSARGVIARTGGAGSHLAEVARSLGVPMVTACRPDGVLGPEQPSADGTWIAALDGSRGEVALFRR
ncbi:MAG TPA: PEP/pyruvate-binding domain-containing protein [Streptosporangiaceae bacterium]|nr:PEP/pyruvate-binding domain-containing protein [Streptosporangiaceae bacterium]